MSSKNSDFIAVSTGASAGVSKSTGQRPSRSFAQPLPEAKEVKSAEAQLKDEDTEEKEQRRADAIKDNTKDIEKEGVPVAATKVIDDEKVEEVVEEGKEMEEKKKRGRPKKTLVEEN